MISINDKHFYTKKNILEKIKFKMGIFQPLKKAIFIGFKVTVVLNEKTNGSSFHFNPFWMHLNDSKIFDEFLQDLQKRRIIKRKDIILFDRDYYGL